MTDTAATDLPEGVYQDGAYANGTPKYRAVESCRRCGGAGGANHWPGFTCFECNGSCVSDYSWISPERQDKLDVAATRRLARIRENETQASTEMFGDTAIAEWFCHGWQAGAPVQLDSLSLDILNKTVRKGRKPSEKQIALLRDRYAVCVQNIADRQTPEVQWVLNGMGGHDNQSTYSVETSRTINIPRGQFWSHIVYNLNQNQPLSDKEMEAVRELYAVEVEGKTIGSFIGEVKQRLELTLTVERMIDLPDYGYGSSTIFIMKDADGNAFSWKTGSIPMVGGMFLNHYPGCTVTLKGTVKDHELYRGVNQTVLARCKLMSITKAA